MEASQAPAGHSEQTFEGGEEYEEYEEEVADGAEGQDDDIAQIQSQINAMNEDTERLTQKHPAHTDVKAASSQEPHHEYPQDGVEGEHIQEGDEGDTQSDEVDKRSVYVGNVSGT